MAMNLYHKPVVENIRDYPDHTVVCLLQQCGTQFDLVGFLDAFLN